MGTLLLLGAGKGTIAAGGGGTVTSDADGTYQSGAASTTHSYTGITVGSLSAGGLVAFITVFVVTESVNSVVWDDGGANQSMSFLGAVENSGNGRVELWGLIAPVSGNKTMTITLSANTTCGRCAASFEGVNQGSIAAAFPNFNSDTTASGTTVDVDITSGTGHMVVGAASGGTAANALTISGTQIYVNNAGTTGVIGGRDTGASTVTVTATYSTNDTLCICGVDI